MAMLPLYPLHHSGAYRDRLGVIGVEPALVDEIDLDLLELRVDPHAYCDLTEAEYFAVAWRYGLGGHTDHSMKDLAHELGCSHAEARELLGGALDKLRQRLSSP